MPSFFKPPMPNWLTHPSRNKESQQPVMNEPQTTTGFANAVYYPNWRIYRQQPPSSLRLGCISHVFYAFARVKPDGFIYLADEYADTQIEVDGKRGCLNALVSQKEQYQQLKIILSIGGGGEGSATFPTAAADPNARETFARSARDIVDQYGLDGIDIDWEHPSDPGQGQDYVHLLASLRATLPSPTYTLTTALPAGEWALRNIPLGQASAHLDFINLMAYDFSGPWTQASGHHAQLHAPRHHHSSEAATSASSATTYMLSNGVPPAKILLGVPAYGRSFLGASAVGERYSGHAGEEGTFEYRDLPRAGAREQVDEQAGAAFCVGGDGGFVTYDNPRTVRLKAQFAKQRGLGGLFYWTGTADADAAERSLVETGYRTLNLG